MLLSSRAYDVATWRQEVNSWGKCGFGALLESRPIHLHLKRKLRKEPRSNHGISFLSAVWFWRQQRTCGKHRLHSYLPDRNPEIKMKTDFFVVVAVLFYFILIQAASWFCCLDPHRVMEGAEQLPWGSNPTCEGGALLALPHSQRPHPLMLSPCSGSESRRSFFERTQTFCPGH